MDDKRFTQALRQIETAVKEARYPQARVLAAALRTERPEAVEGWLWGTWLSDNPIDGYKCAEHAHVVDPSPLTVKAMAWVRKRQQESLRGLASAQELEEISGQMQALPPSSRYVALPAAIEDEEEMVEESGPAAPGWYRIWDAALFIAFALLAVAGLYLLWDRWTTPVVSAAAPIVVAPAQTLRQQAEALWAAGDKQGALAKWEAAYAADSTIPDVTISLARAHVALSSEALRANQPDVALPHLEAAYTLLPDEAPVLYEYQALTAYITGRDAVQARDWPVAIEALTPLFQIDRGYLDTAQLLETATIGQAQLSQNERDAQNRAYAQARSSQPGLALRSLLTPPEISNLPGQTAMPALPPLTRLSDKHIVVSINAQRMYVYENGQLIWDWIASTGEPGRPTVPGRYRIQSKIENARSNVWQLWMPYWQGIYWAGSTENGIHGQVTFDRGGRLWEGYLGTQITFGCVMVSDDNAAQLFNWTEMGTPVSIHNNWDPSWIPDANGDPL